MKKLARPAVVVIVLGFVYLATTTVWHAVVAEIGFAHHNDYSASQFLAAWGIPDDRPLPLKLGGTITGDESQSQGFYLFFSGYLQSSSVPTSAINLGVSYDGQNQILQVPYNKVHFVIVPKSGAKASVTLAVDDSSPADSADGIQVIGNWFFYSPAHFTDDAITDTKTWYGGPAAVLTAPGNELIALTIRVTQAPYNYYLGQGPPSS
jgi:hypothetical protein